MGISLRQPSKPPAEDRAQKQEQTQEARTENQHETSSGPDDGHQRPEQGRAESMIAQHGSSDGRSSMESSPQDARLPRDEPLEPDQHDLQGIGAWADNSSYHANISDLLSLISREESLEFLADSINEDGA